MYRKNVCAILFNEEGKVLGCNRVNEMEQYQFIQGGVEDTDTDVVKAALREIKEEVGLDPEDVTFVGEVHPPSGDPKDFRYDLRPSAGLRRQGFVGQEQRMLLFYAHTSVLDKISLVPPAHLKGAKQEFDRVEWLTFSDFLDKAHWEKHLLFALLGRTVPPKIAAYLQQRRQNHCSDTEKKTKQSELAGALCAIIFTEASLVLGCRRVNEIEQYQFVQGGIEDTDSGILHSALRAIESQVGLPPEEVTLASEKSFDTNSHQNDNLRRHWASSFGQELLLLLLYTRRSAAPFAAYVLVPPYPTQSQCLVGIRFDKVEWGTLENLVGKTQVGGDSLSTAACSSENGITGPKDPETLISSLILTSGPSVEAF
eukprot:gene8803-6189_t